MHCPRCQEDSPAGQKFCGECGAHLTGVCVSFSAAYQPGQRCCGPVRHRAHAEPIGRKPRLTRVLHAQACSREDPDLEERWPDRRDQIERFAREVMPALRNP